MDRIIIRNIVAHGKHGANPGERDRTQPFHLDAELEVDMSAAARSDALQDAVNYFDVYNKIATLVEERSYTLLERVASAILDEILTDRRILRATISIAKPEILDGATPVVRMTRENTK